MAADQSQAARWRALAPWLLSLPIRSSFSTACSAVPLGQRRDALGFGSHGPGTGITVISGSGAAVKCFEALVEAPARVRHWLGPLVPDASREASTLAVSELVTNALIHGRLTPEQRITVAVLVTDGRARVDVSHPGKTFAGETLVPVWEADSFAEGGRGLRLVEAVTDAWGVEPDDQRTIVWFEV